MEIGRMRERMQVQRRQFATAARWRVERERGIGGSRSGGAETAVVLDICMYARESPKVRQKILVDVIRVYPKNIIIQNTRYGEGALLRIKLISIEQFRR